MGGQAVEKLVEIAMEQADRLFVNTEYIFDYADDDLLAEHMCKWPLWRQLYHMLHSMDQRFINPFDYSDHRPDGFTIAALNAPIDMPALTKGELLPYYRQVKLRIQRYLSTLTVSSLQERPPRCRFSRFELLLGQFRHVMFHIGMIHGCILMRKGEIPNYVGLSDPVKPVGLL